MPRRFTGALHEHATRASAITNFVNWLYAAGPDPATVTREELMKRYWMHVSAEAVQPIARDAQERSNVTPIRKRPDGPWGA